MNPSVYVLAFNFFSPVLIFIGADRIQTVVISAFNSLAVFYFPVKVDDITMTFKI